MAFVHDLLERIRHPGHRARGHPTTLSDHVEQLRERQEDAKATRRAETEARRLEAARRREESQARRREESKARRQARSAARRENDEGATPQPVAEEPSAIVDDDAQRRWVPRRP
jgi:hypothetical protein